MEKLFKTYKEKQFEEALRKGITILEDGTMSIDPDKFLEKNIWNISENGILIKELSLEEKEAQDRLFKEGFIPIDLNKPITSSIMLDKFILNGGVDGK